MEYNLPYPNIQNRKKYTDIMCHRGDIFAFEYYDRTGIIFMDSPSVFAFAMNLYEDEGSVYICDDLPDDITLYKPTWEERVWAMEEYLEIVSECNNGNKEELLIRFIEQNCPKGSHDENPWDWKFCFNFLSVVPWFQMVKNRKETAMTIWKEVSRGIENTGLQYNAKKTELYCFLMGVLMIANTNFEGREGLYQSAYEIPLMSAQDDYAIHYVKKLRNKWDQFSWMYGMVIGRVVGSELANFTAVVNGLHVKGRVGYLHLYLPLVEKNIDKILKYSSIEKKLKLEGAIAKMKKEEQLQEQLSDLDDLYEIVFPEHFKESMRKNRPAASINELMKQINDQKIEIKELRLYREAAEKLTNSYNDDAITIDDLKQAIDGIKDPEKALQFYFQLNHILRKNKIWKKHAEEIGDFVDAKVNSKEQQSDDLISSMKEVASRPTTLNNVYPQANSTTNVGCDQKESVFKMFLPSTGDTQFIMEQKNEQKMIGGLTHE